MKNRRTQFVSTLLLGLVFLTAAPVTHAVEKLVPSAS